MNPKTLLIAIALGALVAPAAAQMPVFFDDFFSDNLGQPAQNFNGFIQWNVTDGSVDFVGGNVLGAQGGPPDGRYVELGGSTNDPGAFSTKLALTFLPNVVYNLSFAYLSTNGETNTATATLGNKVFTLTSSDPTQYSTFSQDFSFDQLTSVPLVFQEVDNDNNGIGIDFVTVAPAIAPVPEPTTITALGLGAFAVVRRRRKA